MDRIVQIGSYPLSADCIKGGVEASVYGLAQTQSLEAEVHVFDFPRIGGRQCVETDKGVVVHRYRNEGKRQIQMARQVRTIVSDIMELRPDVCHIHGTTLFLWLIYRNLKKKGVRVALTVHGLAQIEKRNLLRKHFTLKRLAQYIYQSAVEKAFLRRVSSAIVDTEYVRKELERFFLRRKDNLVVIPQGIDEAFFSLDCSKDSRVFLSVGAIGPRKGHLLTLEAYERLRDSGVEARLVIAGAEADVAYHQQLEERIRGSQWRDSIVLMTDLPRKDLLQLYTEAHVFVLHSEEESQGIVFAEAMATGMPVVSTTVGGIPYVVENNRTGLLSGFGDIETFALHMKQMVLDPGLWDKMSIEAKKDAVSYHWSEINKKIKCVYKNLDSY